MAVNPELYSELAKALSQPSKAYRAAKEGLGIPESALQGYLSGSEAGDKIQNYRLKNKTLAEVLGANVPEGLRNTTIREADAISKPVESYASLLKAQKEPKEHQRSLQQVQGVVYNNRPAVFDPDPNLKNHLFYADTMEPVDFGSGSGDKPSSGTPAVPSPRVPPALPAEQINRNAELEKMLTDVNVVRNTKQTGMVGPLNSLITTGKQVTGFGATPEAAIFKSTVAGLRNKVLNLLSGAAISPAEAKRLMAQLPSESRSNVDFDATLNNFERETRALMSERKAGFQKAGFRGVGGTTPIQQPAQRQSQNSSDPLGLFQ